jgi:deoxyribodipyrimidine photo-lyase
MSLQVVWFKRDLRVADHAPLVQAAARGPVLALYVVEPSLWAQPEASAQHLAFIHECLRELAQALGALGARPTLRVGEVVDVLAALHAQTPLGALHAHEETGNADTYARDRAVANWCRAHGVAFLETPQFGVVRRLRNRDVWHRQWEAFMATPQSATPAHVTPAEGAVTASERMPTPTDLGLPPWQPPRRQRRWAQPGAGCAAQLFAPARTPLPGRNLLALECAQRLLSAVGPPGLRQPEPARSGAGHTRPDSSSSRARAPYRTRA